MSVQALDQKPAWKVVAEQDGVRLERFVRQCLPHLSRRQALKAISDNAFLVNGRRVKKGHRLNAGDVVNLEGAQHWLTEQPPEAHDWPVTVVYEDADLVVVDKPAGIATHGFSARDKNTLANFLVAKWPELASVGKSRWQPGLVNRLDKETSGLVLVAKNQSSFERLREQFQRRQVSKKYLALVWGNTASSGSISYPLAHHPSNHSRMQIVTESQGHGQRLRSWRALTSFRKLASSGKMSLLEITMQTGVTHQIRVHLAAIGHAIVGDVLYGTDLDRSALERHFLHASTLEFAHPASGAMLRIESPLPADLRSFMQRRNPKEV